MQNFLNPMTKLQENMDRYLSRKGFTYAGVNNMQIHPGKYAKGIYMVRSQKLFKSN
ncbi:MAG TPA: hypothetical protein VK616_01465 [Flavitalea sp.]|nr:hypothetical protein [Flavitalea sp.]HTF29033.1 hypothetical protein [Flavitalea sp.]